MDIFNRKALAAAHKLNADLSGDIAALRNQVEYLVRTIHEMDQEIWSMSQRTDWAGMRPHFVKLQEGMTARKHAENSRINSLLRGEIIAAYSSVPAKLTGPSK